MNANPRWLLKLREIYPNLGAKEQKIAHFIYKNIDTFLTLSIVDLSRLTGTSKSTIVRFCNHIGYAGLKEFKIHFYKNENIPRIPAAVVWTDSLNTIKNKIFNGCIEALQDSYQLIDEQAIERAAAILAKAKHIDIYGLGGSVSIVDYLRHQLMKIGIRSSVYADTASQRLSLIQMGKNDAAVAVSCSGASGSIVDIMGAAKKLGVNVIAITNFPESPLGMIADIVIQNTGSLFYGDDTNTYSRLAQLATVNFLYIAVSQKTGKEQIFLPAVQEPETVNWRKPLRTVP
jgi:DNA-binding MurR/RpiR family transcriptional regulator